MRTTADEQFLELISNVWEWGDELETRNGPVFSDTSGLQVRFDRTPLLTVRPTAWKKALVEMEWFLSGSPKCPSLLQNWWKGQLNPNGDYIRGYSEQLRNYTSANGESFDQIAFLEKAIVEHPNSRRLITTTWHPAEMASITDINENPKTPTCCHGSISQFFVRNGMLSMHMYQRSADLLLGVHHNWIQYWSLLMFLAYKAGLGTGELIITYGDLHIYGEESHLQCARELLNSSNSLRVRGDFFSEGLEPSLSMVDPEDGKYKAADFAIIGDIEAPLSNVKPKLC